MVRMINGHLATMHQAGSAKVLVQVLNSKSELVDQFITTTGGDGRRQLVEKGYAVSMETLAKAA